MIILGATASGKTRLAVRLAYALGGEIISADSRQLFTGMDIGTGKDIGEYHIKGKAIPYHLIDVRAAGEKYNVNEFKEDFFRVFKGLTSKGVLPILCGGTGMYVHSILQNHEYTAVPVNQKLRDDLVPMDVDVLIDMLAGYPQRLVAHADLSSHKRLIRMIEIAEYLKSNTLEEQKRPLLNPFVVGLVTDREQRRSRIIQRLEARFAAGMIDEVKSLLDMGVSRDMLTFYGLEYKFITAYLFNELEYNALVEHLGIAICQFAKRQMTFFRKMEKDGVQINWFNAEDEPEVLTDKVLEAYLAWLKK
ncbi:MAG TPA: tRNA (adenosine(37)-N6)-dimethylallyltransferase MiaA [Pedobacter sp.]|nr:tRNA (adenosine(37)-N6)-dimethylallyltransferase MiaA [Pedobacter sp.]